MSDYSIIPSPQTYGSGYAWWGEENIPRGKEGGLSVGGWTSGNEGLTQQTFLGASIRSFTVNAGFGDTSSTLSVDLINDEYNSGDYTAIGSGDDIYHNGSGDFFSPPVVGSPVYFKFGKNHATIEQAYLSTFDSLYAYNTVSGVSGSLDVESESVGFVQLSQVTDRLLVSEVVAEQPEDPEESAVVQANLIDTSNLGDPANDKRGLGHFSFGGILQSYVQNKSGQGNPLYSVQVVDPREILANTVLVLNNYQGTTYNNKNLMNIYGFLEYDVSDDLKLNFWEVKLDASGEVSDSGKRFFEEDILSKSVDVSGVVSYSGEDLYKSNDNIFTDSPLIDFFSDDDIKVFKYVEEQTNSGTAIMSGEFPITGQGYARRSDRGIPFYRVNQVMDILFEKEKVMPEEYKKAGFGGPIDFRGYKYVVDLSGLPLDKINNMYYLDFDQIPLLDLILEISEALSHEIFVSLLPVINHPACKFLYEKNKFYINEGRSSEVISGIIRVDSIDKSKPPTYGTIKSFLEDLQKKGVFCENQDVGFELSNVTTDKFVVGAQEVKMHYFTNNRDRDNLQLRRKKAQAVKGEINFDLLQESQWEHKTSLSQQILPYYGLLGDGAVTIPRGFGAYKQFILDARNLNAHGVGDYYVATEMELRAAAVSYERWVNFLAQYNETYIQELTENQAFRNSINSNISSKFQEKIDQININEDIPEEVLFREYVLKLSGKDYGVAVPRSLFTSDKPYMGEDGYPASPCNPPYGYPLYYKRGEKIGIPQFGVAKIQVAYIRLITNLQKMKDASDQFEYYQKVVNQQLYDFVTQIPEQLLKSGLGLDFDSMSEYYNQFKDILSKVVTFHQKKLEISGTIDEVIQVMNDSKFFKMIPNITRKHKKNSEKVYDFIKKVADECLGKKFLVKIPKATNLLYNKEITIWDDPDPIQVHNYATGPFGFRPMPISASGDKYPSSLEFVKEINSMIENFVDPKKKIHQHYLDQELHKNKIQIDGKSYYCKYTNGSLRCNFNPVSEKWEYNYQPQPLGGFFDYEGYNRILSKFEVSGVKRENLPPFVRNGIVPVDAKNLISDNGRIKAYVRYDNAQMLDFKGIDNNSFTQQTIYPDQFVPDIIGDLDNLDTTPAEGLNFSFPSTEEYNEYQKNKNDDNRIVSYITCELDDKLYMPPKSGLYKELLWAREVDVSLDFKPARIIQVPSGVEESSSCYISNNTLIPSSIIPDPDAIFKVPSSGTGKGQQNLFPDIDGQPTTTTVTYDLAGGRYKISEYDDNNEPLYDSGKMVEFIDFIRLPLDNQSEANQIQKVDPNEPIKPDLDSLRLGEIDTRVSNLDSENVYALITIPGKVIPSHDQRYQDSVLQAYQATSIKNTLTQDVVRIANFDEPSPIINSSGIDCSASGYVNLNFRQITQAQKAQKEALQRLAFNDLEYTSPSPVYPDLVALPLMSMERCYGPWRSSNLLSSIFGSGNKERYEDIGGKIEFDKDENIAPWNFAGYQLMNDAAAIKADFSNSLLLFSERGGFVYPDAPTEVNLATELKKNGPLVTSISVSFDNSKISTTVKLDLYTSKFGKLQKQKELAISQISRERQKLIDQNNKMLRKNIGKNSSNNDLFGDLLRNGGQRIIDLSQKTSDQLTDFQKGKDKLSVLAVQALPNPTVPEENFNSIDATITRNSIFNEESAMEALEAINQEENNIEQASNDTAMIDMSNIWTAVGNSYGMFSRLPNLPLPSQFNKFNQG